MSTEMNSSPRPYANSLDDEAEYYDKVTIITTKTASEIMKERRNHFEQIIDEESYQNLNSFRELLRAQANECGYLSGNIEVTVFPSEEILFVNNKEFAMNFSPSVYKDLSENVISELKKNILSNFFENVEEILLVEGFGVVLPRERVDGSLHYMLDV